MFEVIYQRDGFLEREQFTDYNKALEYGKTSIEGEDFIIICGTYIGTKWSLTGTT